jgi:hypothetical protein
MCRCDAGASHGTVASHWLHEMYLVRNIHVCVPITAKNANVIVNACGASFIAAIMIGTATAQNTKSNVL